MSFLDSLGVYRPGNSLLHRAPVGPKLLGLVVASIALVVVRGPLSAVLFLLGGAALAVVARIPLLQVLRALRALLLLALAVAALQWWSSGLERAVESLLDLLTLGLLGLTLSHTTAVTDMLDTFVRWITPLGRFGVDAERVALTVGLAIQSLPATLTLALETRDAARARGLRSPRAYLTPFVIRVVARAHETGTALHARGIGD
ncbi:energy-coupling factor transporter transmembrane protein EcfT [Nocardioides sp. CER19]|uniref:energy-coupling factor transporter transmembrane protein EcfT n=1 Tax=Nocardioides sp. CER19 TaxID=3038538 RepID=UPI002446B391|nr:energy-coupling factor transporter transmembrane protein EcfT [Nocardioides sp. CER19]MDH2414132.1 energy-coupling factor transporter transmembrane protein EcfT [Nocardioides sp. CER19]